MQFALAADRLPGQFFSQKREREQDSDSRAVSQVNNGSRQLLQERQQVLSRQRFMAEEEKEGERDPMR